MLERTEWRRLVGWATVWLGLATVASGEDWSQWRGPGRDGISRERGLLQRWDGEPPLVWQVEGLGKAYSSVAVADGRIFTMGRRKDGEELICLDAETGKELWALVVGNSGHSNCTPTVDGERVYGLGRDGELVCAEAASGKLLWKKSFPRDFGGKMMSGWGYSESPLVDGERLICTPGAKDAAMVALDKRTGNVIWQAAVPEDLGNRGRDGAGYSSIVVSNAGGIRQYVQLTGRGVIGVRAEDGKFLWSYNRIANGTANIPTPLIRGDYVFCSTGYGTGAALLKLSAAGGEMEVEEVYFLNASQMQNHHGGMILLGDYIYCGHGHNSGFPLCIKLETGEVAWRGGRGPGKGSAAIAYADGQLYFRYENGTLALIAADPEKYELRGTFEMPTRDKSWPHPAIANGRLYLRDQGVLRCYDIRAKQD